MRESAIDGLEKILPICSAVSCLLGKFLVGEGGFGGVVEERSSAIVCGDV